MVPHAARTTDTLARSPREGFAVPPPPLALGATDAKPADVVVLRAPHAADASSLRIVLGADAWSLLESRTLLVEWKALEAACPWATPFQSSHFVVTWLRHYAAQFAPVVVAQRSASGALVGLLVLGAGLDGRRLVVAGGHQAEYQAWLALPQADEQFILRALEAVDDALPGRDLSFRYTPPGLPIEALLASPVYGDRATVAGHKRPLMRLDATEVKESLRKKSNKSRWARLQRLGPVAFSSVIDADAFEGMFDDIIACYDARQCAMNGLLPFAQDPRKKPFHLDLMRAHPGFLHVTVTTLSNRVIAAHIGLTGKDEVHLAIVCHSLMHADHSPGKLHLLRLGDALLKEGKRALDLTPGGDPWKERFANAHDDVYSLTIHRSATARRLSAMQAGARQLFKRTALAAGVSPTELRRALREFRRRWALGGKPVAA
jgi:CelD/BcsL family acetyltransferase involved in cellulose biosynthesis